MGGAIDSYRAASLGLAEARAGAGPEMAAELDEEVRFLDRLAEQAGSDAMSARKAARAGHHMKARKRGRRR